MLRTRQERRYSCRPALHRPKTRGRRSNGRSPPSEATAHALLAIDAARSYGLVSVASLPEVDVERCSKILMRAREKGITPAKDAIERYVGEMAER